MTRSVHTSPADVPPADRAPDTVPPSPDQPPHPAPPAAPALAQADAAVPGAPAPHLSLAGAGTVPFVRLCARRPRAAAALLACVAQVWLMHGAHVARCRLRPRGGRLAGDGGMTTAEYAVGTVAACGFAALLYKVVTSGAVSSALQGLIRRALGAV